MKSSEVYAAAFVHMWAERHCERVVVFANGHVYDRMARREGMRQNVRSQRRFRAAGD